MKVATIEVNAGACERCLAHANDANWIPDDMPVESVLDPASTPPFHPNCKCRVRVKEDASPILSKKDWEKIRGELDRIYYRFAGPLLPGPFANVSNSLGKAGVPLLKDYAQVAQSCSERATALLKLFNECISKRGIGSVVASTDTLSLVPFGRWKEKTGIHEWVEVYYEYQTENGMIQRGIRYYDPWLVTDPFEVGR